ncbi:MAG: IMP dehydrogenase, partial [Bacteroidetes bacterium]|nr:IMP dehydrogenase [Bacteroidota bacterium]
MLEDKIEEALTFDDVVLLPSYSEVLPGEVDVSTSLTSNIKLNIPLISAAMDTVTEAQTSISMAQEGGIGIIHKNFSIEDQASEVQKVKKYEGGMIINPLTVRPDNKVGDAINIMLSKNITGLPVIRGDNTLLGIVTYRDLRFEKNLDYPVKKIMTKKSKLVTVKEDISLESAKQLLHKYKIEKLPVVNDKFELKGLITMKDIEKIEKHPLACKDNLGRLRCGA